MSTTVFSERARFSAGAFALWTSIFGPGGAVALGMLLGFGRRSGTLWRPLNAAAHTILGSRADDVWGFQLDVTLTGCAVVLVVSAAAGGVAAGLSSSRRTPAGVASVLGVAITGYLLHTHLVARTPGGLAALLDVGELRALYAVVGIAMLVGMRYAFPPNAGAPLK